MAMNLPVGALPDTTFPATSNHTDSTETARSVRIADPSLCADCSKVQPAVRRWILIEDGRERAVLDDHANSERKPLTE